MRIHAILFVWLPHCFLILLEERGSLLLTTHFSKRAEIPIYSFAKHAREAETTSIYSPRILVLEGIFALYDPRVLELLDMKVHLSVATRRLR